MDLLDLARRVAAEPQPIADRVDDEGQEHASVGRGERERPQPLRASPPPAPCGLPPYDRRERRIACPRIGETGPPVRFDLQTIRIGVNYLFH